MLKILITIILIFSLINCFGQVLLEDISGDQIANNVNSANLNANNLGLIKLNTGDQTFGFNYFISTVLHDPSNYFVHQFGIKAKPTDGYASVFSNSQFSPSVNISYGFTKVPLFLKTAWGGVNLSIDQNKYSFYKKDTSFDKQLSTVNHSGFNLIGNYNLLVASTIIINFRFGYSRKDNYQDLKSVEVKDVKSDFDASTSIERQVIVTKNAKDGKLLEYDSYPMSFSITKCTATDALSSANASKLKIGYTFYIKNLISNNLPKTDVGFIFIFTKQDKNGIRNPVFGFNIQAQDFFDNQRLNTGLLKRFQFGFTTNFTP